MVAGDAGAVHLVRKRELPSKGSRTPAELPALFLPFLEEITTLRPGERHNSSVAEVEHALADWFREHTGENVRIVGDYQTMPLLSSLSNKVSLSERKFLPIEMSAAGREQMSFIKDAVLRAPNGCAACSVILMTRAPTLGRRIAFKRRSSGIELSHLFCVRAPIARTLLEHRLAT